MGNSETFGKVLCLYVVAENAARLASQEGAEKVCVSGSRLPSSWLILRYNPIQFHQTYDTDTIPSMSRGGARVEDSEPPPRAARDVGLSGTPAQGPGSSQTRNWKSNPALHYLMLAATYKTSENSRIHKPTITKGLTTLAQPQELLALLPFRLWRRR